MKILLTGATGYIGKRLLPVLAKNGHTVICCVRDANRFNPPESIRKNIQVLDMDLLDEASLAAIPVDIDAAYYLVHSMSTSTDYEVLEKKSAINFRKALAHTRVKHVLYLSGIINETSLSKHLGSRKQVEEELARGEYNFTTLRAGVIIGSGSASFEIIRDLVEKLPVMITPKWLHSRCQPIAISDVILFLEKALLNENVYNQNFDIGGPDILTYKEMLLRFAYIRKLKRYIFTVPVMTPRLSSYWLYFITATSYKLAVALVDSMKIEVLCRDQRINTILNVDPLTYEEALHRTFAEVEENQILSSWKDSLISANKEFQISEFIHVPTFGCFIDKRSKPFKDRQICADKIWRIGGNTGWYYANSLWKLRGIMDKLAGGVGLRRGRTNVAEIHTGDVIDFWRVLYANKKKGRLLLFAEMKLPGEAWLEFNLSKNNLVQTATFRPIGLWGRLYWYLVYPFHELIFGGMIKALTR